MSTSHVYQEINLRHFDHPNHRVRGLWCQFVHKTEMCGLFFFLSTVQNHITVFSKKWPFVNLWAYQCTLYHHRTFFDWLPKSEFKILAKDFFCLVLTAFAVKRQALGILISIELNEWRKVNIHAQELIILALCRGIFYPLISFLFLLSISFSIWKVRPIKVGTFIKSICTTGRGDNFCKS